MAASPNYIGSSDLDKVDLKKAKKPSFALTGDVASPLVVSRWFLDQARSHLPPNPPPPPVYFKPIENLELFKKPRKPNRLADIHYWIIAAIMSTIALVFGEKAIQADCQEQVNKVIEAAFGETEKAKIQSSLIHILEETLVDMKENGSQNTEAKLRNDKPSVQTHAHIFTNGIDFQSDTPVEAENFHAFSLNSKVTLVDQGTKITFIIDVSEDIQNPCGCKGKNSCYECFDHFSDKEQGKVNLQHIALTGFFDGNRKIVSATYQPVISKDNTSKLDITPFQHSVSLFLDQKGNSSHILDLVTQLYKQHIRNVSQP